MNIKTLSTICSLCCIAGILYYALAHEIILLNIGLHSSLSASPHTIIKKNIKLPYYLDGTWHTEDVELLWPHTSSDALSYVISSWLTLLDEENVTDNNITVQSVVITTGHKAYVSFDQTPFAPEQSIHNKWVWTEGLLAAIRASEVPVTHVHVLVHHQSLDDPHLDFSHPWPVTGFYSDKTIAR